MATYSQKWTPARPAVKRTSVDDYVPKTEEQERIVGQMQSAVNAGNYDYAGHLTGELFKADPDNLKAANNYYYQLLKQANYDPYEYYSQKSIDAGMGALDDFSYTQKNGADAGLGTAGSGPSASGSAYAASGSAPEYAGSEWDQELDRLARELAAMNYEAWTGGDQYAALARRYGSQGKLAMQDVLGQVSSRTGGLASSYAATAANQQYNDYLSKLEEVARQMYADERSDKLKSAQLARQLAQDDYARYQDALEQWNANRDYDYRLSRDSLSDYYNSRDYDYQVSRDETEDWQWAQELALQQERLALQGSSKQQTSTVKKDTADDGKLHFDSVAEAKEALFEAAFASGVADLFIDNKAADYGLGASKKDLKNSYPAWAVMNKGSAATGADYTSLDYSPDEGVFTWNGRLYISLSDLMHDLTADQVSIEERRKVYTKLRLYGFQVG